MNRKIVSRNYNPVCVPLVGIDATMRGVSWVLFLLIATRAIVAQCPAGQTEDACGVCGGIAQFTESLIIVAEPGTGGTGLEPMCYQGIGAPFLPRDVNPGPTSSNPNSFVEFKNRVYFAATTSFGVELHIMDCAPGISPVFGTRQVEDFIVGAGGSDPQWLQATEETLYFACNTPSQGRELCTYNGNSITSIDINVGPADSNPKYITRIWVTLDGNSADDRKTVVLAATTAFLGEELWISRNTTATTMNLDDINSGLDDSEPAHITWIRGSIVFSAIGNIFSGRELYGKNLTTMAPAVELRDIASGMDDSDPQLFTAVKPLPGETGPGNGAYFSADVNINNLQMPLDPPLDAGVELMQTIGRVGESNILSSDFNPGSADGNPTAVTFLDRRPMVIATNGTNREAYIQTLDVFPTNVTAVFQICTTMVQCEQVEQPAPPPAVNETILVTVCETVQLCTDDPASPDLDFGVTRFIPVTEYVGSPLVINATKMAYLDDVGMFVDAEHPTTGREVYFVDDDATSYAPVQELVAGPGGVDDIAAMTEYNGMMYMAIRVTSGSNYNLYRSDGATITLVSAGFATQVQQFFVAQLRPPDNDCGICGGGASEGKDVCGVCFGNGTTCGADCFGVPSGPGVLDACGDCRNTVADPDYNKNCLDCNLVLFGPARVDACGVCQLDGFNATCFNQSCIDCAGEPNGNATRDACGVCEGDGTSCTDCSDRFFFDRAVWPPEQTWYPNPYVLNMTTGMICNTTTDFVYEQVCNVTTGLCSDIAQFTPQAEMIELGCYFDNGTYLPEFQWQRTLLDECEDGAIKLVEECNNVDVNTVCSLDTDLLAQLAAFYLDPRCLVATEDAVTDLIIRADNGTETVFCTACYSYPSFPISNGTCVRDLLIAEGVAPVFAEAAANCTGLGGNVTQPAKLANLATTHPLRTTIEAVYGTEGGYTILAQPLANATTSELVFLKSDTNVTLSKEVCAFVNATVTTVSCPEVDLYGECLPDPGTRPTTFNVSCSSVPRPEPTLITIPCVGNDTYCCDGTHLLVNTTTNCTLDPFLPGVCEGFACSLANYPLGQNVSCPGPDTDFQFVGRPFGDALTLNASCDSNSTCTTLVPAQPQLIPEFLVVDVCGVCGGDGSSCLDCNGTPNGTAIVDPCGLCTLPDSVLFNKTCRDCAGVIGGPAFVDLCGVCRQPGDLFANFTCQGCDGVPNSGKVNDICNVCGGDGSTCNSCDGILFGSALFDGCGVCRNVTDPLFCPFCDGSLSSLLLFDACGVCGGDNSTCSDCTGVVNGTFVLDACGLCFPNTTSPGFNATCLGCDNVAASGKVFDICGVCGGDNSTCSDCLGVINGTAVVDACGVCNGTNSTCVFCPAGQVEDACGVCGGNNSTCIGKFVHFITLSSPSSPLLYDSYSSSPEGGGGGGGAV